LLPRNAGGKAMWMCQNVQSGHMSIQQDKENNVMSRPVKICTFCNFANSKYSSSVLKYGIREDEIPDLIF
jgi:hypothetical protein